MTGGQADPLRVLVVQPYAERGGSESWLLRLLPEAMAQRGDRLQVSAVLLKDGPLRQSLHELGIPVELHEVGPRPVDMARAVPWLTRRLRAERPDVVLANVVKAQLIAGPAGRLAGVPTVWAKHDHGYDRTLAVPLGRLATRVIGAVEELAAPVRRRDAVVVPPPRPDLPPASREQARAALRARGFDVPTDAPVVVMAGRLVPFKGVEDLLRALALPGAAGWVAVIAGEDDHAAPGETARLRGVAASLGVGDRVLFWGHVAGLAHDLAAFDALAVLTRSYGRGSPGKEGFGTSAFEAMLAGVPVLTVDSGAVARRLERRAGVVVPSADPEAVARALAVLADPVVRRSMGAAGIEITAGHPDARRAATMLLDVLDDAAAAGHRKRSR